MIKLLHTADLHLGAKFTSLGEKGLTQRDQIRKSFKNLVSQAIADRVDLVLIAGDLFDSNQQPQTNIDLVVEQFSLLATNNIPVCLIPGTHDYLGSGSIYRKVNFTERCPNLMLFTDTGWSYKEFPNLGLTVYGRPNYSNRSYTSPLEGLQRLTETQYHVAMAHGSLHIPGRTAQDDHVFTTDQIYGSQMQYIALGHWHRQYSCSDTGVIAWYSGAPEMVTLDQKEAGGILIVTIFDSGEVVVTPKRTGLHYFEELVIDLSDLQNTNELRAKIAGGADLNLVRRVVLTGFRNEDIRPPWDELEAEFSEQFFHLKITDQSHPRVIDLTEAAYQDRLILTRFFNLMKEHIELCQGEELGIAEEALQYGLALLQGKEVL
jgi:exonuclease SbcD